MFVLLSWIIGTRPRVFGDSVSYLNFPVHNPVEALDNIRTFGYPLFLRIVQTVFPDLRFLPQIQVALYCAAVFFFYASCIQYGFPRWAAWAAATPLLYQRVLWDFASWVLTDVPAAALGLLSIGCLMRVVVGRRPVLNWVGLILGVFLAYQVRPAYLFLVPLIPVLALLFLWLRDPPWRWDRSSKGLLARSAAAAIIPLVLFCAVRLAVVGNFGLVSFAGVNIIGITTQFMTPEMVSNFDQDLRPLALAMIERRDNKELGIPGGQRMIAMPDFIRYYNLHAYDVFLFLAQQYVDGRIDSTRPVRDLNDLGKDAKPIEDLGRRLAFATIEARPGIFAFYYFKAFLYAVSFTLYTEGTIVLLALAVLAAHFVSTLRVPGQGSPSAVERADSPEIRARNVLIFLAAFFYLAKLLLTITVEAPAGRYLVAAAIFIPSALGITLLDTAKKAFPLVARLR